MSAELLFTADRSKFLRLFQSHVAYNLFIWAGGYMALRLALYLYQPLTERGSLFFSIFIFFFSISLMLLFVADWWRSQVTISGSTLIYRSWLRSHQIQLTQLTDVVITQTAAGEIQQIMLRQGSVNHKLGLDINYMSEMKLLAESVKAYVNEPRYVVAHSEPLSKLLLLFVSVFGGAFVIFSFYSLDFGLLLLLLAGISCLARFYPHISAYLSDLTPHFEGKIITVALLAIGYGVYHHGPAGHPCGYVGVWVNQTHCVRAWQDYLMVGISADDEQILLQSQSQIQIEPLEPIFPIGQRQFTTIDDPSLTTSLYDSARLASEKKTFNRLNTIANIILPFSLDELNPYLAASTDKTWWIRVSPDSKNTFVINSSNAEPMAVLPPADLAAFAHHTQLLALLSEGSFLIYQLPQVELITEIPLPAGFTNLTPQQGCLTFVPEQPWLIYYQPQGGLLMIDVTTQEMVEQFTTSTPSDLCFVAFLPEQNELVLLQGQQLQWRTLGQTEINHTLELFTDPSRLSLSPNGRWLALQAEGNSYLLELPNDE